MTPTQKNLKKLDRIANLLDNEFSIGPFKFGIDPIIGLIPGIGDLLPVAFSLYIITIAHQEKLSNEILLKMATNAVIDVFIGTIPLVGDLTDFFFKASEKNMKLLRSELERKDRVENISGVEEGEVI